MLATAFLYEIPELAKYCLAFIFHTYNMVKKIKHLPSIMFLLIILLAKNK